MMRKSRLAVLAAVLSLAGCDAVYGLFYSRYDGPLPEAGPITGEVVIARIVKPALSSPEVAVIYGDRVKYLRGGDPHDVNRVVYLELRTVQPRLDTTQVRAGDTLRVTTRYDGRIYLEGRLAEVPDWPYPKGEAEHPIGRHTVLQYQR